MQLNYKRLYDTSPYLDTPKIGNAGFDLKSAETITLEEYKWTKLSTGIALEIPVGYVGLVRGRSGNAFNNNLFVFEGTIDSGYRGEIFVCVKYDPDVNMYLDYYQVKLGDKIAQIVIVPYFSAEVLEVDTLSDTERGNKGLGSSGR